MQTSGPLSRPAESAFEQCSGAGSSLRSADGIKVLLHGEVLSFAGNELGDLRQVTAQGSEGIR